MCQVNPPLPYPWIVMRRAQNSPSSTGSVAGETGRAPDVVKLEAFVFLGQGTKVFERVHSIQKREVERRLCLYKQRGFPLPCE